MEFNYFVIHSANAIPVTQNIPPIINDINNRIIITSDTTSFFRSIPSVTITMEAGTTDMINYSFREKNQLLKLNVMEGYERYIPIFPSELSHYNPKRKGNQVWGPLQFTLFFLGCFVLVVVGFFLILILRKQRSKDEK